MEQKLLEKKFKTIGARVKFLTQRSFDRENLSINIGTDNAGEFFSIRLGDDAPDLEVIDAKKTYVQTASTLSAGSAYRRKS